MFYADLTKENPTPQSKPPDGPLSPQGIRWGCASSGAVCSGLQHRWLLQMIVKKGLGLLLCLLQTCDLAGMFKKLAEIFGRNRPQNSDQCRLEVNFAGRTNHLVNLLRIPSIHFLTHQLNDLNQLEKIDAPSQYIPAQFFHMDHVEPTNQFLHCRMIYAPERHQWLPDLAQ